MEKVGRTKVKEFVDIWDGNIGYLDFIERDIWLALESPKSTTTD